MGLTIETKKKLAVIFFLITGVTGTFGNKKHYLAYKLQSSQIVTEAKHSNKHFFHPYIQSFTMFVGEALCLIVYFIQGHNKKKKLEKGKNPHRPYIFFVPAFSDAISSILQYMGLAFIAGSTYVMFKGASIVTTAIFSRILVKMTIEKRHIAGCGAAVIGLVIVGSSGFFGSDSGSGDSTFVILFLHRIKK